MMIFYNLGGVVSDRSSNRPWDTISVELSLSGIRRSKKTVFLAPRFRRSRPGFFRLEFDAFVWEGVFTPQGYTLLLI